MGTLTFSDPCLTIEDLAPRAQALDDDELENVLGGYGYWRRGRGRRRRNRTLARFRHMVRMRRYQQQRLMQSRRYRRAQRSKPSVLSTFKKLRAQRR